MSVQPDECPAGRGGILQRRVGEALKEGSGRLGLTRGLEGDPIRFGLVSARDHVVDGLRQHVESNEDEQRYRYAPGSASNAYHATPFQM